MKTRSVLLLCSALIAASGAGYYLCQNIHLHDASAPAEAKTSEHAGMDMPTKEAAGGKGKILFYRNPMVPSDTSPVPKTDSMGMTFVPVYETEVQAEPGTVQIGSERVQKLGVRTEVAAKQSLTRAIKAVGIIQADERRETVVNPRFEGWIKKLYVNTTGQKVKRGDPLLDVYSPELLQAEREYLIVSGADSKNEAGRTLHGLAKSALEKLKTLEVPQDEIDRLQREKTPNDRITLRAQADGTVIEKRAVEGMKFASGDMLYSLAELGHVWAMADIYEQDLSNIAVGQTATVAVDAIPGKTFEGTVGFIYPQLSKDTRTAKARIDLHNEDGQLRPDMYAQVKLASPQKKNVLAIPTSAVLNTGERKAVLLDLGEGRFRPQAVKTGAEGDGHVEIVDGIKEGDRVVTSASFLIDAESNIRSALQNFAKPEEKQPEEKQPDQAQPEVKQPSQEHNAHNPSEH